MIELESAADMWNIYASAHVITTNGSVNSRGECVMGRGCALEAKEMFPGLALELGRRVRSRSIGNHLKLFDRMICREDDSPYNGRSYRLISFPVKHRWYERADLKLIERSAGELVALVDDADWLTKNSNAQIVLPRPGCGNGHLRWSDVRPVIEPLFDDRFLVVHR